MRILIFNWRDIKKPESGGAEVLTHEMAKRWVKWGHQVTQFSAAYPNCQNEEIIDGVKIIRRGAPDIISFSIPVHFYAFWFYVFKFRGKFEIIVDEIHGIPFFTPLFVKEKKVALICEVAKEIWDKMFSFPWNVIGRLIEKFYFKIYRRIPFLTISLSTKKDLIAAGISKKNITVLPMGVTLHLPKKIPLKTKVPTLIFVGRVCRMKGVDEAIKAMAKVRLVYPKVNFWIVGGGETNYLNSLKKLIRRKKLNHQIKFWGYVTEEEKFKLLARAWILVHPSRREGWGLVVHEANSVGTPVVAYNSPGLRDIVKDGINGLLCQQKPKDLSLKIVDLLNNKSLYQKLQKGCCQEVKKCDWEKTAKMALDTISQP